MSFNCKLEKTESKSSWNGGRRGKYLNETAVQIRLSRETVVTQWKEEEGRMNEWKKERETTDKISSYTSFSISWTNWIITRRMSPGLVLLILISIQFDLFSSLHDFKLLSTRLCKIYSGGDSDFRERERISNLTDWLFTIHFVSFCLASFIESRFDQEIAERETKQSGMKQKRMKRRMKCQMKLTMAAWKDGIEKFTTRHPPIRSYHPLLSLDLISSNVISLLIHWIL